MVMRDQSKEGNFRGQGEPEHPPAILGFLDRSLARAGKVSGNRGDEDRTRPLSRPELSGPNEPVPGPSGAVL